ncbi:MAG: hypothetical protein ACFB03_19300 [Paracoccaceae bacterium]
MTDILRLLTAGALAASSAVVLDMWFAGQDRINAVPSLPAPSPELAAFDLDTLLSEPDLTAIKSKPLFHPSRRPPQLDVVPQAVEIGPTPSFTSNDGLGLHGIFIAGNRRSALISVQDDTRFWLSEGDKKSGVELVSILPKSAVVRQDGRQILLHIDGHVLPDTSPTEGLRS